MILNIQTIEQTMTGTGPSTGTCAVRFPRYSASRLPWIGMMTPHSPALLPDTLTPSAMWFGARTSH